MAVSFADKFNHMFVKILSKHYKSGNIHLRAVYHVTKHGAALEGNNVTVSLYKYKYPEMPQ